VVHVGTFIQILKEESWITRKKRNNTMSTKAKKKVKLNQLILEDLLWEIVSAIAELKEYNCGNAGFNWRLNVAYPLLNKLLIFPSFSKKKPIKSNKKK
jgi:hypothetical protein